MPIFVSVADLIRSIAHSGFLVKTIHFLPTLNLNQVLEGFTNSSDEFLLVQVFVYSENRETPADCQNLVTQIRPNHHVLLIDESQLILLQEILLQVIGVLHLQVPQNVEFMFSHDSRWKSDLWEAFTKSFPAMTSSHARLINKTNIDLQVKDLIKYRESLANLIDLYFAQDKESFALECSTIKKPLEQSQPEQSNQSQQSQNQDTSEYVTYLGKIKFRNVIYCGTKAFQNEKEASEDICRVLYKVLMQEVSFGLCNSLVTKVFSTEIQSSHSNELNAVDEPPVPTTIDEPPVPTTLDEPPVPTTIDEPPMPTTIDEPPMPTTLDEPPVPTTMDEEQCTVKEADPVRERTEENENVERILDEWSAYCRKKKVEEQRSAVTQDLPQAQNGQIARTMKSNRRPSTVTVNRLCMDAIAVFADKKKLQRSYQQYLRGIGEAVTLTIGNKKFESLPMHSKVFAKAHAAGLACAYFKVKPSHDRPEIAKVVQHSFPSSNAHTNPPQPNTSLSYAQSLNSSVGKVQNKLSIEENSNALDPKTSILSSTSSSHTIFIPNGVSGTGLALKNTDGTQADISLKVNALIMLERFVKENQLCDPVFLLTCKNEKFKCHVEINKFPTPASLKTTDAMEALQDGALKAYRFLLGDSVNYEKLKMN